MVSFRDAFFPEYRSGRIKPTDIQPDEIHPNDTGHKYAAEFVTLVLDRVLAHLPDDSKLPAIKSVPKPLISDLFEHATMFNADSIQPAVNTGWTAADAYPFGHCWESSIPGSTLEFDVTGDAVSVVFTTIRGDMGIAQAQVDDHAPVNMDGWFSATWGGFSNWALIARDLGPGKHRLRIRLLEDKDKESTGHKFQVQSIMTAGINGAVIKGMKHL
jgi:hypothetical protein